MTTAVVFPYPGVDDLKPIEMPKIEIKIDDMFSRRSPPPEVMIDQSVSSLDVDSSCQCTLILYSLTHNSLILCNPAISSADVVSYFPYVYTLTLYFLSDIVCHTYGLGVMGGCDGGAWWREVLSIMFITIVCLMYSEPEGRLSQPAGGIAALQHWTFENEHKHC